MLGVHASVECVVSSRRALVSALAKRLVRCHRHGSATILLRGPQPCCALCHRVSNLSFSRGLGSIVLLMLLAGTVASVRTEPTLEELKARVSTVNVGEKAKICLEIAEMQLNA